MQGQAETPPAVEVEFEQRYRWLFLLMRLVMIGFTSLGLWLLSVANT